LATAWRPPGPKLRSIVQHLAAGVVFAAAAGEILPEVMSAPQLWPALLGALLGVAAMALLQVAEERLEGSTGLVVTAGFDVFIDGFVLGLGFLQGAKQGLLLTVAVTLELLFLGLSVAASLGTAGSGRGNPRARVLRVSALMALALPLGTAVGLLLGDLPPGLLAGFYAFGLIALLYLVTEELLSEAHETPDTPLMPAAFFLGFLGLLMMEALL
jgi:ZIP family zinc transporter